MPQKQRICQFAGWAWRGASSYGVSRKARRRRAPCSPDDIERERVAIRWNVVFICCLFSADARRAYVTSISA